MFIFLLFLILINSCFSNLDTIHLNTTNNIIIRGEINTKTVSQFIYNLKFIKK